MKPFMLDDKLERDKNQPNFVKTGEVNDASSINVRNAIARDNAVNAEKNVMLQSCGGYRFLFAICYVKSFKYHCRILNYGIPEEPPRHKCVLIHNKDPFTKLGPFKVEFLHDVPFFMIIHELFTEEDIQFFIDWAKPKLSEKRIFNNKLDSEKPSKNAHLTQKTTRTVYKSVQAFMHEHHPRADKISSRLERV